MKDLKKIASLAVIAGFISLAIGACGGSGWENRAYWGAPPTITHGTVKEYANCVKCHETGKEEDGKVATKIPENHDIKKGHVNCVQCHVEAPTSITAYKKNNF
ncbi:MAG: nitrate reductase cytochrome c-type subunit [Spirochaetia bacterium]|nr:nitrate reductase cytochrome c-type subunit [Spirochaetia bacterium]